MYVKIIVLILPIGHDNYGTAIFEVIHLDKKSEEDIMLKQKTIQELMQKSANKLVRSE